MLYIINACSNNINIDTQKIEKIFKALDIMDHATYECVVDSIVNQKIETVHPSLQYLYNLIDSCNDNEFSLLIDKFHKKSQQDAKEIKDLKHNTENAELLLSEIKILESKLDSEDHKQEIKEKKKKLKSIIKKYGMN